MVRKKIHKSELSCKMRQYLQGCLRSCYQNRIIQQCGCGDPHFPLSQGSVYCNISQSSIQNTVFLVIRILIFQFTTEPCIDYMNQCGDNSKISKCNCPRECK